MYGGFATTAWNFVANTFFSAARTSERVSVARGFSSTFSKSVELQRGLHLVALHLLEPVGPVHVRMKARGVGEPRHASQLRRGHDEARARERAGVVVEVDADDAIERVRDDLSARPSPGASRRSPRRAA